MHLLNMIMKLGRTIPHFEDIAPCDIFDEDSCCCCTDTNPFHFATPIMPKKSPENTGHTGIDQRQTYQISRRKCLCFSEAIVPLDDLLNIRPNRGVRGVKADDPPR
jgi:hypothetical protein